MDQKPETDLRPPVSGNESLGSLVKEVAETIAMLVRKEIELAREETMEIVRTKLVGAAFAAVALVAAVLLIPFILLSLIEVGAIWLPRWASSLIVTGLMVVVGIIGVLVARAKFRKSIKPERTIETIKEDVEWAKNLREKAPKS